MAVVTVRTQQATPTAKVPRNALGCHFIPFMSRPDGGVRLVAVVPKGGTSSRFQQLARSPDLIGDAASI